MICFHLHQVLGGQIGLEKRKFGKIASFSLACSSGLNVTIVECSKTFGKLKGPVQKLFSMICFHLHKVGGQIWTQTAKI